MEWDTHTVSKTTAGLTDGSIKYAKNEKDIFKRHKWKQNKKSYSTMENREVRF